MFKNFLKDEKANLMALGTELTGFLVLVGLVLIPVGYASISGINKTAVGIVTGSSQDTIITSILTISLAVIIMALISRVGKK